MTQPFFDRSRDRAIEDFSNLWLIHPLSRAALPLALRLRISANAVSILGLLSGLMAAFYYFHWQKPYMALLGLFFSVAWLVADGLDGLIARATGTSTATGRILDGICDHIVFIAIYLALALSVDAQLSWILAAIAGLCHAIQSGLYESERARYHRRIQGNWYKPQPALAKNPIVRGYDAIYHALDRQADTLDQIIAKQPQPEAEAISIQYQQLARAPMKFMSFLSANTRVWAIFIAIIAGSPNYFWFFEIAFLSLWMAWGLSWHRRVERHILDTL